jgi:major histocompatibility complex class I
MKNGCRRNKDFLEFNENEWLGVVVHAFNPSTQEAEAGGFLSSRPAWSTK